MLYAAGGVFSVAFAGVTSSGLNTAVDNSISGTYTITGGTRPGGGTNLFHSFGDFSLNAVETAKFVNDSGLPTTNILSRVTGGNPSNIFGTIDTTDFPGANLFLMNPAGILFGPTAQLNVDGSFHATTADYIGLADGARFNAVPSSSDALLTAAPPADFGFLTSNPGAIEVQTGVFDPFSGQLTSLQVPEGQTLSLVGGTINIAPSATEPPPPETLAAPYILAPGGTVNVASVASPGEVALNDGRITTDGFTKLGDVTMSGGSIIDGQEIFIRSGQLVMSDSALAPGQALLLGQPVPFPTGGQVDVRVSGDVTITGFAPVLAQAGIQTFGGVPFLIDAGDVPSILVDAGGSLSMSGFAAIQATRYGPGDPGKIEINADTVSVASGSVIGALNYYDGPGTPVTVNSKTVTLTGDPDFGFTGIFSSSDLHPLYGALGAPVDDPFQPELASADSGPVTINAVDKSDSTKGELAVTGGAEIYSDSRSFGSSSDITLTVGGDALFSGQGSLAAQSELSGASGNITLSAGGQVNIQSGFRVSAATFGSGNGGTIDITAQGGVKLDGTESRITSITTQAPDSEYDGFAQHFALFFDPNEPYPDYAWLRTTLGVTPGPNDLMEVLGKLNQIQGGFGSALTSVDDLTPGDAGTVSIADTPVLTMNADTRIETSTAWDGNAGKVDVNVGSLFLSEGAYIRSTSGQVNIVTGQPTIGSGNAGEISLSASDTISISGSSPTSGAGSSVSTTTYGNGSAGDISLSAGMVAAQDGGNITSESGGTLNDEFFVGAGNAGAITINTTGPLTVSGTHSKVSTTTSGAGTGGNVALTGGNVEILNGGSVTSDSFGNGIAGDITIAAGNKIDLNDGTISTRAVTADGGNITLTAPDRVYLFNSDITTSVESGFGGGGNITIDPQFVILNQSDILANAFGGPGGNINIVADNVISSAQSRIDASSALGIDGTVNVSNPDQEVAQELAVLPENFLDVTGLISDRCSARAGASSLVAAGPGGLAVDPDGYLPSFTTVASSDYTRKGGSSAVNGGKPWWALAEKQSALRIAQVTCTR